jgi:flagellin
MKELNVSAATTTITDQERRYLFVEFEALHNELTRIALTTEFNGIPLLNGDDPRTPDELIFRVDDPTSSDDFDFDDDLNVIRFEGLRSIVATAEGLGLESVRDLLSDTSDTEGISLRDVEELMEPLEDGFATIYDEALARISTQRAVFGAMQSRLQRAINFAEVYQENIAAAKSNIADTDYAREIVKLTESNILMQASSSLLAQSNFDANITLNLLSSITR